jgi:hypothetical protein
MSRPEHKSTDTLICTDAELANLSLFDFWKWAFSDLCDDDLKGIFAEWLVMRLLRIPGARRVSWANSDIITPENSRIEVKASSYWQSWKLLDERGLPRTSVWHPISPKARIAFAGLKARDAVAPLNSAAPREFKSHIYVFALQAEKEPERWNAMDLSQWEFYVLSAARLREMNRKSISLAALQKETEPLAATDLRGAVLTMIQKVARTRH